jgi:FkbM family methyltransferase
VVDWIARALDCLRDGDVTAAEHSLRRAHALDESFPFTHRLLGCAAAWRGEWDEADRWFAHSAACRLSPDTNIRLGPAFLDSLCAVPPERRLAPMAAPESAAGPQAAAVVFVSGDCAYFRRFCFPLLASAAAHGNAGKALLWHFHIINPDAWLEDEFAEVRDAHAALDVRLTVEKREFGSLAEAKAYFACARFLLLPEILAAYDRPVLQLDFDQLVLAPLQPLIDSLAGADVALLRWPRRDWRLWDQVSASAVLARPGAGAQAFFGGVANYVAHFLGRGGDAWFLDQIALYALSGHAARLSPTPRMGLIPADVFANYRVSGADDLSEGTVFWSVTYNIASNAQALESDLFRRYLPTTRSLFGWTIPGSDQVFQSYLAGLPVFKGRKLWEMDTMQLCLEQTNQRTQCRRKALDIGGHVGFWSYWLAEHFDSVEAFEPSPELQHCFARNVPHDNVTLHACALGEADGSVGMNSVSFNTGMTHVAPGADGGVAMRTLDGFGFEDVDFIKMDAEGYELFILQGGERTLRRCRPLVFLEHDERLAQRYGAGPYAALELLCGMGAKVLLELHNHNYLLGWDATAGERGTN